MPTGLLRHADRERPGSAVVGCFGQNKGQLSGGGALAVHPRRSLGLEQGGFVIGVDGAFLVQTGKEYLPGDLLARGYDFFEDVCTINEILSFSQRFEVAKMLREGRTYLEIAQLTGASTATISRVNRSLNYGNESYDKIFEKLY